MNVVGLQELVLLSYCSLLAESPARFAGSREYIRCHSARPTEPYSVTNKGLRLELFLSSSEEPMISEEFLISEDGNSSDRAVVAVLDCYFGISPLSRIGIYLTRTSDVTNQYVRTRPWNIKEYPPGKTPTGKWSTIYVKQRHRFQLPKAWGVIILEVS
jgi:hypothetical protein